MAMAGWHGGSRSTPDESLSSFDAWFSDNRIEQFKLTFLVQGFRDLETIVEITIKEELHAMGIHLLGDKLKLMSKIRDLKTMRIDNAKTVADVLMPPKRLKQSSKLFTYILIVFSAYELFVVKSL